MDNTRYCNQIVSVKQRRIFESHDGLEGALGRTTVSGRIDTSFLPRQNGAVRGGNARKARKTYRFSKNWEVQEATTYGCCFEIETRGFEPPRRQGNAEVEKE